MQAIADGETSDDDLIKDIPELQEVDRTEASKRFFYTPFLADFLPLSEKMYTSYWKCKP